MCDELTRTYTVRSPRVGFGLLLLLCFALLATLWSVHWTQRSKSLTTHQHIKHIQQWQHCESDTLLNVVEPLACFCFVCTVWVVCLTGSGTAHRRTVQVQYHSTAASRQTRHTKQNAPITTKHNKTEPAVNTDRSTSQNFDAIRSAHSTALPPPTAPAHSHCPLPPQLIQHELAKVEAPRAKVAQEGRLLIMEVGSGQMTQDAIHLASVGIISDPRNPPTASPITPTKQRQMLTAGRINSNTMLTSSSSFPSCVCLCVSLCVSFVRSRGCSSTNPPPPTPNRTFVR